MKIHVIDARDDETDELKAALDASGVVGTWDWDFANHLVRYDRGAAELLAANPDLAGQHLDGATARAGIHPDDIDWLYDEVMRVSKVGGLFLSKYRVITRQGEVRWLVSRGRVYQDELGHPVRGRGIIVDITENREPGRRYGTQAEDPSEDPLDEAASHILWAHKALKSGGTPILRTLVNALLLEVGHEIAKRLTLRLDH